MLSVSKEAFFSKSGTKDNPLAILEKIRDMD